MKNFQIFSAFICRLQSFFHLDLSEILSFGRVNAKPINPLPDDKIFDWSKLSQTADYISKYI